VRLAIRRASKKEQIMHTQSIATSRTNTIRVRPSLVDITLFNDPELSGVVMPFTKGSEIYGEKEPVDYVYKLLTGSVRTYSVLNDGRRHIGAFYLPGDIFGMESGPEHALSAEAITDATILLVRRSMVMDAAKRSHNVMNQLLQCTARELNRARDHVQLLIKTAQERVASFLLEMSERLSEETVELPMSRQDIADYLGLTIETVSRTLTQLGHKKAIELPTSRTIVLRNRGALARLNS
jgi:CRP-like cAMP-binding protein